jgi:hypothetical protein
MAPVNGCRQSRVIDSERMRGCIFGSGRTLCEFKLTSMEMKMTKLLATLVASMFVAGAAYADDVKNAAAAPAAQLAAKKEAVKDAVKAAPAAAAKAAPAAAAKVVAKKDAVTAAVKDEAKK